MREIQASEAKAKFSALLDAVERGETIAITRHGETVARIVPNREIDVTKVSKAIEGLKALRAEIKKTAEPISTEELLAMRHEDHKY